MKVLERDGWRCTGEACAKRTNPRVMLVVHHKRYPAGYDPWDYAPDDLTTLCEKCHNAFHQHDGSEVPPTLIKGAYYLWREIAELVGHAPYGYLTEAAGQIVCGCFRMDLNPDAPSIVLPGGRNRAWVAKARLFQQQGKAIPIFVKAEGLPWEFVGNWRVEAITQDPVDIRNHRHGLTDIGGVMFLSQD